MSESSDKSDSQGKANQQEELVVVYRSMGQLRAHVIKGKLASVGIPAVLVYESAGPVMGIAIDGLGDVQVRVPKSRAKEALEVIASGQA